MEREAKFKESRNVSKRSLARGELYQAKLKAHLRLYILLDNLENRERETDDSDSAGNIIYIYINHFKYAFANITNCYYKGKK